MLEITLNITELTSDSDRWFKQLKRLEKSDNTIKTYKNGIQKFIDYLNSNSINQINKDAVLSYKDYLKKLFNDNKMSLNTLNQRLIVINKFFRDNGFQDLTVKTETKEEKPFIETITDSDYQRLIRWADKLKMEREKLIIQTLANTGCRASELAFFTVENLKGLRGNGYIEVTNKGKTRYIAVPKEIKRSLLSYAKKKNIKTGVIFHGRNPNKLLDKAQIWRNLKYIAGRARVKKAIIKPHNFRHFYSTHFLDSHGNIAQLKINLGHSDIKTTERYSKTSKKQAEDNFIYIN